MIANRVSLLARLRVGEFAHLLNEANGVLGPFEETPGLGLKGKADCLSLTVSDLL